MTKIIPLKTYDFEVNKCGKCPFFDEDLYAFSVDINQIHSCKANSFIQTYINGDPPLLCPLQDKVETKFIPTTFVGCENYGTTWKGCYGYY